MMRDLDIITYINQSILNTFLLHPTYNLSNSNQISHKKQLLNTRETLEEVQHLVSSIPSVLKFLKNEVFLELENTEKFKVSYKRSKDGLSRLLLNKITEGKTEGISRDELSPYIEVIYSSLPYKSANLIIDVGLYSHAINYSLALEGELSLLKIQVLTEVKNMIELDKLYFTVVENPIEKDLKVLFKEVLVYIYNDLFEDEKTLKRNTLSKASFLESFAQIVFNASVNDLFEGEIKLYYNEYLKRLLEFIKRQNIEEYNPIVYFTELLGFNFFEKAHNSILKRKIQSGEEINYINIKNLLNENNIIN